MQNFIYGRKIPKRVIPSNSWINGIGDFDKGGGSYYMSRGVDIRTNPRQLTLLPASVKESGSNITDLVKWGERVTGRLTSTTNTYLYGDSGNIYKRTSAAAYSLVRTVPSSHGNGMRWFGEDDYIYYAGDKSFGRFGPVSSATPTWNDDFLTSLGGVPTNTNSLLLASASSQYMSHVDGSAYDITGNITMEAYLKPTTLPTVGNSMTIMGKWDESSTTRAYKFDIYAISGYFGGSQDGNLTISSNTTDSPIDSTASGTSGTTSLTATNASFASGQYILIHQSQGTGAGSWQKTTIQGYTAGTITTADQLNFSYGTGAQVLVMKQYGNVTINNGFTYTAKAWNGSTGGILAFTATGTISVIGQISGSGCGFRGSAAVSSGGTNQGEGYPGVGTGQGTGTNTPANGNGAGGSTNTGCGGGNGTAGSKGTDTGGAAGGTSGSADLTTMLFGGGGSGAESGAGSGAGGNGGSILFLIGVTITITGSVVSNGANGGSVSGSNTRGGGAGAGGSILLKAQTATLGTNLITASGGAGGVASVSNNNGGPGGDGRIHIDYLTSFTGSTTPTLTSAQDNTLVTTTTYQLRIGISNDGTANEYLAQNASLTLSTWQHVAVAWTASTSTAQFYLNGSLIGTVVGTKTAISNNASAFTIGGNNSGSGVANFLNSEIDDVRLWSVIRSGAQILASKDTELAGTESGLAAYYKFDNNNNDSSGHSNTLTSHGTPTFQTDVPFKGVTSRLDQDQTHTASGSTYTLPNAISESGTNFQSFTPAIDPQKSIAFIVSAQGTGDWTVTIHDAYNNVIASQTITHANVPASGAIEFTWTTPWSPVAGATYHYHITSSTGDGQVQTGTLNDVSTAQFTTYFSFLINDTAYHPIERIVNIIAVGNGRYVAVWDGTTYTPNRLKLPSPWKVRCFAQWNDYIAIGCWKGDSITAFDDGMIFLWNAANVGDPNATYDYAIPVPMGGINAMLGVGQTLYFFAGYQGDLCKYILGGEATKVKRIPKVTDTTVIEVMPGAMGMWHSIMRFGLGASSIDTNIQRGVYSWGHRDEGYPDSLNMDSTISTGNYGSTVQVGMILAEDNKLLVSWKDNTAYGVDVIDPVNNPCQATGTVEEFIFDAGFIWKNKKIPYIETIFAPLTTGQSITVKYKLDRASNWNTYTILPTDPQIQTNNNVSRYMLPISEVIVGQAVNGIPDRFNEMQIARDLNSTSGVSPTLYEQDPLIDFLLDEQEGMPGG